jgi:hypothetical protein
MESGNRTAEIRLYDCADGVKGHYCVGRKLDGYSEYWTGDGFSGFGKLYTSKEDAEEIAKLLTTSQQCASLKEENERLQEAVRTANVEEQFFKVEIIENPFIQSAYPIKKKWGVKFTIGVQTFTLSVQRTKKEATWFADCLTNALTQITRKVK